MKLCRLAAHASERLPYEFLNFSILEHGNGALPAHAEDCLIRDHAMCGFRHKRPSLSNIVPRHFKRYSSYSTTKDSITSIRKAGDDLGPLLPRALKMPTFIIILTKSHTASEEEKPQPENDYPTMASRPFALRCSSHAHQTHFSDTFSFYNHSPTRAFVSKKNSKASTFETSINVDDFS